MHGAAHLDKWLTGGIRGAGRLSQVVDGTVDRRSVVMRRSSLAMAGMQV